MKKSFLTIIGIAFLLNLSFAQEEDVESVVIEQKEVIEPKIFKLEPEQSKIVTKSFQIDSVIDNRIFKQYWGITQKGLGNKNVPIAFEEGTTSIKKYLNGSIVSPSADFKKLVLVINHLWMSRTGGMMEAGLCELDITFCSINNGNLEIIHEFSDELDENGMNEVTSHIIRLKKLLIKSIKQVDALDLSSIQTKPFEFAKLDTVNNIINTPKLEKGYYKTYVDFYNNTPEQNPSIKATPFYGNENRYKLIDIQTKKRARNYYGFCDGENIYLNAFAYGQNAMSYYSKVLSKGRFMLVDDNYIDPYVSAVGASFGLIGGLVAASTNIRGMLVDMKTGLPMNLSDEKFEQLLGVYPELLEKYTNESKQNFKTKLKYINILNTASH